MRNVAAILLFAAGVVVQFILLASMHLVAVFLFTASFLLCAASIYQRRAPRWIYILAVADIVFAALSTMS